ncbi:MAG: DUF2089 domain-containing protein [Chloroflexi bacterium]|nr:DUF2089 domain-containing protein [Chloroflexota bacterium]
MKELPKTCPFCGGDLLVLSLACRQCDTHFQGRWFPGKGFEADADKLPILTRFAQLSSEQLKLLESFILCEGKLNRLQDEVGLSYPTLRSRLNDIIAILGGPTGSPDTATPLSRRQILDNLAAGEITAAEAAKLLQAL